MRPMTKQEREALAEVRRRLLEHQRQTLLAEILDTGRNYTDRISQAHRRTLEGMGIPVEIPSGTFEDPDPPPQLPPAESEADLVLNVYRSLFGFEAVQAVLEQMAAENLNPGV